jgi:uncharacterized protein (DUF58 family)
MATPEQYLKPEIIRQVARLDLKAKFIIEGFFAGLHASPFHGFSAEFSEHRRYTPGDDLKDIDWSVYAKTDKFYVKKFEAETNLTAFLVVDLSASMGYTHSASMTKLEYAICLSAALGYLMVHQQDSVGLVTFADRLLASLPPRTKRTHLANMLAILAKSTPQGPSRIAEALGQLAAMIRHRSLVILFSDLLADPDPIFTQMRRLRHRGNDLILFHVLDQAERKFPFRGPTRFLDLETPQHLTTDADGIRASYLAELERFCEAYRNECNQIGADYVSIDTSVPFDKALTSYLVSRQSRF